MTCLLGFDVESLVYIIYTGEKCSSTTTADALLFLMNFLSVAAVTELSRPLAQTFAGLTTQ